MGGICRMARSYRLILSDYTYDRVKLLAEKNGKSMGKMLNELIEWGLAVVKHEQENFKTPICAVCGEKASILVLGKGEQIFALCENHESLCQKFPAFKPINQKQ